jgi:hypothetical protein
MNITPKGPIGLNVHHNMSQPGTARINKLISAVRTPNHLPTSNACKVRKTANKKMEVRRKVTTFGPNRENSVADIRISKLPR